MLQQLTKSLLIQSGLEGLIYVCKTILID